MSRCPPEVAAEHLLWLAALMHARGAMFRAIRASGAFMPLLPRGGDGGNSAQLWIG